MEEKQGFVFKDYTLVGRLDKGLTAHVWLAIHNPTGIKVALKVIEKSNISNSKLLNKFMCCLALIKHLKHPFFARYIESMETQESFVIALQYCENGTLEELIEKKQSLSEDNARKIFIQIVLALDFLHNNLRMAHRDMKPQNILLDKNNIVHLTDFGLSKSFSDGKPLFSTFCGTPQYIAPEILNGQQYSAKADIWSLGVVLYFMIYNSHPFTGNSVQEISQKISYSDPEYSTSTSYELINLMQKLLNKNPDERPSIREVLGHRWLNHTSLPKDIQDNIDDYIKNESRMPRFETVGQKLEFIEKEKENFKIDTTYCRRVSPPPSESLTVRKKPMRTSHSQNFTPRVVTRMKSATPIIFPRKKSSI